MPDFACQLCGKRFEVSDSALARFPGWTPKTCMRCKNGATQSKPGANGAGQRRVASAGKAQSKPGQPSEQNLTVAEVLATYSDGPASGVFTDGASHPNPGPGGWGAVYVVDGHVRGQAYGSEPNTTNNRMELIALIEGFKLVPEGEAAVVWTDSQLCVKTINDWARGWEKNGWRRKTGPIKNLELVKQLYALHQQRPELELRWIKAHSGLRWNEYADSLATAYRRGAL